MAFVKYVHVDDANKLNPRNAGQQPSEQVQRITTSMYYNPNNPITPPGHTEADTWWSLVWIAEKIPAGEPGEEIWVWKPEATVIG